MKSSIITAGVAMFALGACATTDNPAAPEPPASAPDACPIVQSADWKAWVNRMPGPGATPTLIVEGQVTLPTPGYTIELKLGRTDRSMTPVQQLILVATPPAGQVIPTLTPLTARIAAPAIAAKYKAVQIVCNGEVIAQVTDVPDAF